MQVVVHVLVPDGDTERFVSRVLGPALKGRGVRLVPWIYASERPSKVVSYITSATKLQEPYYFLTELSTSPCVTRRKAEIRLTIPNIDNSRIIIVKKVIESWIAAGAQLRTEVRYGFRIPGNTDRMGRAQFERIRPSRLATSNEFKAVLLEDFNIPLARRRNRSFDYFQRHRLLQEFPWSIAS